MSKVLAEIYTNVNRVLQSFEEPSLSIKRFQDFVAIYNKMSERRGSELSQKV